ncbi:transcriptional regulator XRE family [Candidatus Termititenax persephonae]|uniref:Transcriptional regulator XRE family n=1 Tax=Candidatus Termititenax persephonae TaxID=2218525 RepID=A0A388TH83_9BACT|nr:transcriptional regulator XRE family [Candidatus Termititenax persephonae]
MKETELLKVFGFNIKKQRQRLEWSQEKLAETIDISIPFLSDVENGKKWVSLTTLLKLAEAFGLAAHELLRPAFLPEGGKKLLSAYTRDIQRAVNKAVDRVRQNYLPTRN